MNRIGLLGCLLLAILLVLAQSQSLAQTATATPGGTGTPSGTGTPGGTAEGTADPCGQPTPTNTPVAALPFQVNMELDGLLRTAATASVAGVLYQVTVDNTINFANNGLFTACLIAGDGSITCTNMPNTFGTSRPDALRLNGLQLPAMQLISTNTFRFYQYGDGSAWTAQFIDLDSNPENQGGIHVVAQPVFDVTPTATPNPCVPPVECINPNSTFADGGQSWQADMGATFENAAKLGPAPLNTYPSVKSVGIQLDTLKFYKLKLVISADTGSDFKVDLGQKHWVFSVDDSYDHKTITIEIPPLSLNPDTGTSYTLKLRNETVGVFSTITVFEACITEGGGDQLSKLGRPLAVSDEHPQWRMYDQVYLSTIDTLFQGATGKEIYAYSNNFGAKVYSVAAGQVQSIRPFDNSTCKFGGVASGVCYMFVPDSITSDGFQIYKLNLSAGDVYSVDVSWEAGKFITYIVRNPTVKANQGVSIGCIIGQTIQLLNISNFELNNISEDLTIQFGATFKPRSLITNIGFAGIIAGDPVTQVQDRIYPRMLTYPDPSNPPCGQNPAFSSCLMSDAELKDPAQWQTAGTVSFTNPGFILASYGSLLKTQMTLNSSNQYSMTVNAKLLQSDTAPKIELTLGQHAETANITAIAGDLASYTILPGVYPADFVTAWTVQVRSLSQAPLQLVSICVTQGDPATNVNNSCYFNNNSFDYGTSGWAVTGDVQVRPGSLSLPSGATIAQQITLPGDGSTQFQLFVDTYLNVAENYTISPTDTTNTVEIDYKIGSGNWQPLAGPSSQATTTFGVYALARQRDPTNALVSYQDVLTPQGQLSGLLTIRVTHSTVDGVYGVGLARVCLNGKFGTPPGSNDPPQPGTPVACEVIGVPTGNTLADWIPWHWAHLNQFFKCDLMVMLKQMYAVMLDGYKLFGWNIRYWKAGYFQFVNWLGTTLLPWLSGQLANIATGRTTIIQSGGGGTNLFDALIGLFNSIRDTIGTLIGGLTTFTGQLAGLFNNLVNVLGTLLNNILQQVIAPIVNLLINLINAVVFLLLDVIIAVIGIAFSLFNLLWAWLSQMLVFFYGLISSWNNSPPQAVPGLPLYCATNPKANPFCVMLWAAENTIFSGTGRFYIPLIIAYGFARLILWSVGEFKRTLMQTGAAL